MQNKLLSIFKAITPDNIKDIPVIEDSMRMFIELLSEYSHISSDIKIALSEDTTEAIAEELPKIYLYDYFSMIDNIQNNKNIVQKFRNWNAALKPDLYPKGIPYIGEKLIVNYFIIGQEGPVLSNEELDEDINNININPLSEKLNTLKHNMLQNKAENYYVNRLFKQSKGLNKAIYFLYDILNEHIVSADERLELTIEETGNPFELNISGSVDKDIYRESVEYLAHPLGFVYNYTYISELKFTDDYAIKKSYKINTLEVRCLSGNVEKYTKNVSFIIERPNYIKILFVDGFYLIQENDTVKYFNNLDVLVKVYPAEHHCSIFVDYDIIYISSIEDYTGTILDNNMIDNVEISDSTSFTDVEIFDFGFIVGNDTIGENVIRKDTDVYEIVKTKDSLLSENIKDNDDTYIVTNLDEEFEIVII